MFLALALTLASAPAASTPVRVDLFQARLDHSVGTLVPELAKGRLAGDISNIVAGSILTVLGGGFAALGIAGLSAAAPLTGSDKTVFTVLGWTGVGFGGLLAAIGIPLLVVGIVRVATPRRFAGLELGSDGQLALRF
jgi:hypothetical protein